MRIVAFLAILLGVVVCVAGCPSGMETPSPDQPKASFQETPTAGTAVAHAAGRPAAKEPVAAEPGPKQKPASKPTPELTEAILRYLGCKPGDSNVVRLCGMDLKGRGGPPPGVILLGGTQFEQKHVGPSGAVTVIGQAQGEPKVSFEEGTIVELAGGDAFVWKGGKWTPKKDPASIGVQIANGPDDLTLVRLKKWEPRGLVESTRTHIYVDKNETVRFSGEGGIVKDGKRWGQPAELIRVTIPGRDDEEGELMWLGPEHTFIAEPEWAPSFGQGAVDQGSLPGGEHILHGNGKIFGYKFSSDESYPLTFKFVSGRGYVYMCGKGTLTMPSGKKLTLENNEAVSEWLKLLADKDQIARERASQALGYLTSKEDKKKAEVVKALSDALLMDAAMEVRRNSAQSLGRIGDRTALEVLSKVKQEEHASVRTVVQEAISRLLESTK